jgi:hypothetical protein
MAQSDVPNVDAASNRFGPGADGISRPYWPWLASLATAGLTVMVVRCEGRVWWCACGRLTLWSGNVWSSHNSQHLVDPYAFTHVLHGVVFCGLLAWACPRLAAAWRLGVATSLEGLWEILENSNFIIQRYRETTMSLDYEGDSVGNVLGDIVCCGIGFWLARQLGLWRSIALFLATEGVLLLWIRDDLLLNVVMLIYPIESIKVWQMGH